MENFESQFFLAPKKVSDDTWVISRNTSPETRYPLIDAVGNTGNFVGAILAEPDRYAGKTFYATTATYTLEENVATISKTTGKNVIYKQISTDEFMGNLSVIGRVFTGIFAEGFKYGEEYNYFGSDQEDMIVWAVKNASGKLTTSEEYLTAHPLKLT